MRALVIEGGGMRAAYANGVLAAFEDDGYRPFDVVYGTSAGGALAAWWTAGQARFALDTWKYVEDRRIMSYRRWIFRRGPLLDHDGLFRIVYETEQPLDVEAVMRAPHPVVVTVTNAETGETEYVDVRRGPVLAWLRATGRLPMGTGPVVEVDGERYLDGGLTDPIPVSKAIADGATDVTLILNRPKGDRRAEPRYLTDLVARRFPALADAIRDHHGLHNRAVALAERPPVGVAVHVVRPEKDLGVGRLTRSFPIVKRAIDAGVEDGRKFVTRRMDAAR